MADGTSLDLTDVLAIDETVTRSTGSANFGITPAGFLPKPFTRLLAEKIVAAGACGDSLPAALAGTAFSLPGAPVGPRGIRLWCSSITTFRQLSPARFAPDAILSLPFPVRQGKLRTTLRQLSEQQRGGSRLGEPL